MGLFDKKHCDICGEKIGLLGNRKLEDGNLCKECAKKLSPWFDERRHSTVAQIQEQLDYREANKEAVAAFNTTRTLGREMKVVLDEDAGRFMVTSARNYAEANPDVMEFSQVTGCDLDIKENRTEETREIKDSQGRTERVSYNPPRYRYSYDFFMIIHVNTPYFDEIRFKLNRSSIAIRPNNNMGMGMAQPGYRSGNSLNSAINGLASAIGQAVNAGQQPVDPKMQNPDYAEYYNMGMEIKEALTSIRTQVREDIAAAAAPKQKVTCPWCGATTTVGAAGVCEYCGGALNG